MSSGKLGAVFVSVRVLGDWEETDVVEIFKGGPRNLLTLEKDEFMIK